MSRNSRKIRRILRKIVTAVLALVIMASFAAGLTMTLLCSVADNSSVYSAKMMNSELPGEVYESLEKSLERKMALVAINPEDIAHILTKEHIADQIPYGAESLTACLTGNSYTEYKYENDELLLEITALLQAYADENGIEFEEGSAEKVYAVICDTVTAEVSLLTPAIAEKIHRVTSKLVTLADKWYLPVILWAVCVVAVLIIGRRRIIDAAYNVVLPTYLGSFAVFAAAAILCSKDYLSHTVLGDEPLQTYLQQLWTIVFRDMRSATAVVSGALFIAGLLLAYALATGYGENHRRKRKSRFYLRGRSADGENLITNDGVSEIPDGTITELSEKPHRNDAEK